MKTNEPSTCFSILIIRCLAASNTGADAPSGDPGIQILCITLEKDRPGRIMNRIAPLPEQGTETQKIAGNIGPAFSEMFKACRPSCVLLDPDNCLSSTLAKAIEQKIKNEFFNVRLISATARDSADNEIFDPDHKSIQAYGHLKAVPGIPLIRLVRYPGFYPLLIDAMHQMGFEGKSAQNRLGRMRVDETLTRLWELGDNLEYHFEKPGDIPVDLMDDIVEMVGAGGSVDTTHVRNNLKAAYLIGYAMENGVIVGDSSLKHPRQTLIERLKDMTGLDFTGCVERGYTSVRPEYRSLGIGTRLLEGLTKRALDVRIYSIIDEKNIAAQKIAIHNNTRKITQYFSERVNKNIGVWMPDDMADKFLNPKADADP